MNIAAKNLFRKRRGIRLWAWLTAFVFAVSSMLAVTPALMVKADTTGTWGDSANIDTGWYDQHTGDTTFTITTASQLAGLAKLVNSGDDKTGNTPFLFNGITVKLGCNIDLSAHEWVPIGNITNRFKGTFDGQDYTVSHMTIGSSQQSREYRYDYVGLFGFVDGSNAYIANVKLTDAAVYTYIYSYHGGKNVGGLIGQLTQGTVNGCSVSGVIDVNAASYVGGLIGVTWDSNDSVSNCFSTASVNASNNSSVNVGGLIGYVAGNVTNCYSIGSVSADNYAGIGGLIGVADSSSQLTYSFYNRELSGQSDDSGKGKPEDTMSMEKASTYPAWSASIWSLSDGSYPALKVPVSLTDISGVTIPAVDGTPVTSLETNEYTGTVTWSPNATVFVPNTVYTATIRITPKSEYVLSSAVFTVPGADSVNNTDSGTVKATFPVTGRGDGTDTDWYDNHTADSTYTINTAAQLAGLAKLVNTGDRISGSPVDFSDKTIKLGCNIDLSGQNWVPIGSETSKFMGTFDGQGNTISNLTIGSEQTPAPGADIGLFGYVRGSIKDTVLTGVSVHSAATAADSDFYVGSLVGHICDGTAGHSYDGTVEGCSASGTIVSSYTCTSHKIYAGGLVGYIESSTNHPTVHISNSHAAVDVALTGAGNSSGAYAGGLVGGSFLYTNSAEIITDCYASGNVNVTAAAPNTDFICCSGGLMGYNSGDGSITGCYYLGGDVTAMGGNINSSGGLTAGNDDMITDCYSLGARVKAAGGAKNYAGGFIGYLNDGAAITDCYCVGGTVTADGTANNYSGGFAGDNDSAIFRCYCASGAVTATGSGTNFIGGFLGIKGQVAGEGNCYFDTATTGLRTDCVQGFGLPVPHDADLKGAAAQHTLVNLVFTGNSPVWAVTPGWYPHLKAIEQTLSFDSAGGSAVDPVTFNPSALLASPSAPNKAGYSFAGWYTAASGGQAFDFSQPVMQGQTLYAHWTTQSSQSTQSAPVPVTVNGTQGSGGSYSAEISSNYGNTAIYSDVAVNIGGVTLTLPSSVINNTLGGGSSLTLTLGAPGGDEQAAIAAAASKSGVNPLMVVDMTLIRKNADGTTAAEHSLSGNVTVTAALTADQLAAIKAGADPHIYYYDPDTGALTDMNATFDLTKGTATFVTNHFSSYIVTVKAITPVPANIGVTYDAHVQGTGWQAPVFDGALSGTTGRSLRLEALKISLTGTLPAGASITYQAHVQKGGWQKPVSDGTAAGTQGKSLRLEALRVSLNGLSGYAVKYRAYVQNEGWLDWVTTANGTDISNATVAGTTGKGLRVEAVEIEIVKAG